jgi:hypothetical protein
VGLVDVFASPFFVVRHDEAAHTIVLQRTTRPFASVDEGVAAMTAVALALSTLPRRDRALLVDAREGPARNDPEWEAAFAPLRKRMLGGFARCAVLMRTAAGRLQAQRYMRVDEMEARVFDDEAEALAHCATPLASR